MASGIARGRVRTTTMVEFLKMAAILQLIGWQKLTPRAVNNLAQDLRF